ncbi:hypothetical protein PG990_006741 [Apiospora arundinis]|uniref:Uncharacterized protein n=1 Tax=Apiospora arundinis TaxID=335852 RepID=A0ABR2JAZ8_9PEZI
MTSQNRKDNVPQDKKGKAPQAKTRNDRADASNAQEKDPPLREPDPTYYSQSLHIKRKRAIKFAKARLQSTAYTILDEAGQSTILDAVVAELRERVKSSMNTMAFKEKLPYDELVEAAISKVFYDKLSLFDIKGEDGLTVDELLHYEA